MILVQTCLVVGDLLSVPESPPASRVVPRKAGGVPPIRCYSDGGNCSNLLVDSSHVEMHVCLGVGVEGD